jgi:predicted Zn-dependent protease
MAGRPASPIPVPPLPAARSVFFAPIGDFPISEAEALVEHYHEKFGIGILPPLALPREAYDTTRRQVIAERVLDAVSLRYTQAADPAAVVIALTDHDLYIAASTWKYAYGLRIKGHLAVVSTAHLSDGLLGDRTRRLQKMITKNIGLLYFGLQQSDDPKSVLYRDVGGPMDLDRMSEDF